jgi:hypothetical protein
MEARDKNGCTPLLAGAHAGQERACIALAAAGADLAAKDAEDNTVSSLIPHLGAVLVAAAAGEMDA